MSTGASFRPKVSRDIYTGSFPAPIAFPIFDIFVGLDIESPAFSALRQATPAIWAFPKMTEKYSDEYHSEKAREWNK